MPIVRISAKHARSCCTVMPSTDGRMSRVGLVFAIIHGATYFFCASETKSRHEHVDPQYCCLDAHVPDGDPFAYKRPIDLLKVWLGVLTVAQLFQVYAIMQIRMPPSQAHEDMLVSPWTSTFGGNPVKEDLQMKTAGQQMGAKGDGTVINEKKWAQSPVSKVT